MMIGKYAPPGENNTEKYYKFIKKNTGVQDNRKIKEFNSIEFKKLWGTIEKTEGWKTGSITEEKQITAIKKIKGTIVAYHVTGLGWITKGN